MLGEKINICPSAAWGPKPRAAEFLGNVYVDYHIILTI
jgi:hypothetical protein